MIIIFIIILTFSWFKEKISGYHLKNSASKRPDISWCIIICPNNNFRWSILSCLNLWCKMMMCPTPITHITNFDHNSLIKSSPSLIIQFFFVFSLHFFNSLFFFFLWSTLFALFAFYWTLVFFLCLRLIIFRVGCISNINVNIFNLINIFIFSFWNTIFSITIVQRWLNLRIIKFSIFLFSLTLKLLSKIFLLLCIQTFK